MNHKNERIKKLWARGVRDAAALSRKTGLSLARITEGLAHLRQTGECRDDEEEVAHASAS